MNIKQPIKVIRRKRAYKTAVGLRLEELRKRHDLTQKEMGALLEIPQSTYQAMEQGRAEPGVERLIKLKNIYHLESIDELLSDKILSL